MLLIEWLAWWEQMPALQAEEQLNAYTVHLLGNPGWDMERDGILGSWRRLAAGLLASVDNWIAPNESPGVTEEDFKPGALRKNTWRVWHWLRSGFGGGIG